MHSSINQSVVKIPFSFHKSNFIYSDCLYDNVYANLMAYSPLATLSSSTTLFLISSQSLPMRRHFIAVLAKLDANHNTKEIKGEKQFRRTQIHQVKLVLSTRQHRSMLYHHFRLMQLNGIVVNQPKGTTLIRSRKKMDLIKHFKNNGTN